MYKDINGFILAGGKSSRMGTDKALLYIEEKKIIEIAAEKLKKVFKKVFIITNNSVDYSFLNFKTYTDIYKNKGPLSGIHSALVNSDTENNFIISCDTPLISSELIKIIINTESDKSVIIPKTKRGIEPLCGVYSKQCLPSIKNILLSETKNYCMNHFLEKIDVEYLDMENSFTCYTDDLFFNLNTKKDYKEILTIFNNSI